MRLMKTFWDQSRPNLVKVSISKRPKSCTLTSPKGSNVALIRDYIYESPIDRASAQYTWVSSQILIQDFFVGLVLDTKLQLDFVGVVLFTLLRLFLGGGSCLVSASEGLIWPCIRPPFDGLATKCPCLIHTTFLEVGDKTQQLLLLWA